MATSSGNQVVEILAALEPWLQQTGTALSNLPGVSGKTISRWRAGRNVDPDTASNVAGHLWDFLHAENRKTTLAGVWKSIKNLQPPPPPEALKQKDAFRAWFFSLYTCA